MTTRFLLNPVEIFGTAWKPLEALLHDRHDGGPRMFEMESVRVCSISRHTYSNVRGFDLPTHLQLMLLTDKI